MSFPSNTYLKIIKYLNITIADAESVQSALDSAESSPEVEAEVNDILSQLAALESSLLAERNNPNSAMIRADVVEWEGGGARSRGMIVASNNLKRELANLLGLTWNKQVVKSDCGSISIQSRTIL